MPALEEAFVRRAGGPQRAQLPEQAAFLRREPTPHYKGRRIEAGDGGVGGGRIVVCQFKLVPFFKEFVLNSRVADSRRAQREVPNWDSGTR